MGMLRGVRAQRQIAAYIDQAEVVDTHEHLRNVHDFSGGLFPFLFTASFVKEDLFSSGLDTYRSERVSHCDSRLALNDTEYLRLARDPSALFARIGPHLGYVKNTTYHRALMRSFRDLYGFRYDAITPANWRALSDAIIGNYRDVSTWCDYVIKSKCRIAVLIRDLWDEAITKPYIRPVYRFDYLLFYRHRSVLSNLVRLMPWDDSYEALFVEMDKRYGGSIDTFGEYLSVIDREMSEKMGRLHIVGIKVGLAYNRTLHFENVSERAAERVFHKRPEDVDASESKVLQDFVMHRILKRAADENLVIQIHTGMQGVVSDLAYANPKAINNLLLRYPEAKFDLFHGGYPFLDVLLALCKVAPNAHFNLCWLPLISEDVAADGLNRALDMIPSNKILWGGDCSTVEEIYGATVLFKTILGRVLSQRVAAGKMSLADARYVAGNVLSGNARRLYGLSQ
jgi:hypothetical protein